MRFVRKFAFPAPTTHTDAIPYIMSYLTVGSSVLIHLTWYVIRSSAFIVAAMLCAMATAQELMVVGPDGKPRPVPIAGGMPPQPSQDKPGEKKPDGDGEKKDGDKKEDEKSPEPKVIRRDDTLSDQSDPDEFKSMVGDDGRVAFEFRNQPWVDLVQWLADISDLPLDWLELPGDRVNLRSPGRYTVVETRDLFNRYLLARGYTLLEIDGGLTVAKTDSINPAIVPRVGRSELAALPMHSFVRTSLDVGWLSAEKLSEELRPMISTNGRLTALTSTNRIEAMDAAVNLRQVAELLDRELDDMSRQTLAPEFKLRHLPAEEAKRMLEQFLGVEKKKETPLTQQQIQMMQRNGGGQPPPPAEKKVEISIVANSRQNSVIIRAPVDRVAIATQFLTRIDVPSDDMVTLSDIKSRVQVFRLASLDPEKLIEIIGEMNILEPTTRIRVDKDNNALIVSGSPADRYVISSLIERLDGSGRSFEVMALRRLDPTEVAESIAFLMGQKDDDKEKQSNRRSYYYGFYGSGGDDEKDKEKDEFRVAANARYKQILLWANDTEMAQVRSLLIKLGELPPPGGNPQTVRILDASATPETLEYLRRLKQQWNRVAPNELELPDADVFVDPNARPEMDDDDEGETEETDEEAAAPLPRDAKPVDDGSVAVEASLPRQLTMVQTMAGDDLPGDIRSSKDFDAAFGDRPAKPTPKNNGGDAEPIRIELDSNGNLVLISRDTEALDRLESLMLQVTPPRRPYRVFHIQHASATWMKLNLEDYFKDLEEDEDSAADTFYSWYFGSGDDDKDKGPSGLGKGNKLKFVDDLDTNTLVVTGASGEQLQTITELIALWDVMEPVNKRKARFTRLLQIKFGKADKIAETVKEAYRDLLSSNDKTFAAGGSGDGQNGGGKNKDIAKSREGSGSELQNTESGRDGGGADFSFKGKLSLGVDMIGNTILVSAEGEPLLELVAEMIDQLDDAARPQGEVQIVELSGGINGDRLQAALKALGATGTESAAADTNANDRPSKRREDRDR